MAPSPSPIILPDLSWLWDLLNSISGTVVSWFQGIWDAVESIVNIGQGIFAGLVAFGSQLWDAFLKGMETIGSWFYNAFKWIYDGFCFIANVFGEWVSIAFSWIGSGLAWIAQQFYNFGIWLYNGLTFIWNWLVNTAIGIWNAIVSWFSGVATAIGGWWATVTSGINAWFTNILKAIRQKILQTIVADVSIYFGWKGMERLSQAQSLKDVAFGFMGIIASPFTGYLFAHVINGLIPIAGTEPYQLIPTIGGFSYTPPSLEVATPTEPEKPTMGAPPALPMVYRPYVEVEPTVKSTYDRTYISKDIQPPIVVSHAETVESSDKEATINSDYEVAL